MQDIALICTARRAETADVVTFGFRLASGGPFRHLPGQSLTLELPAGQDGETLWRTFTIASAPTTRGDIEITVKAGPHGQAAPWMHRALDPGMTVKARGPGGRFSIAHHYAPSFALISAGSGATPMMSMLRWLADRGETVDVLWVHAAHAPADILFREELRRLDAANPNLTLAFTVSAVPEGESWSGYRGRLDRRMLSMIAPDLPRREVFCCGPAGFMDAMERIHRAEGGDPARFHTESFGPATPAAAPRPVPDAAVPEADRVTVRIGDRAIPARKGDRLIDAARAAGIVIPSACGEGVCGTCRVKRVEGSVDMRHNGGLTARQEREGYILACSSRLTGDLAVERV